MSENFDPNNPNPPKGKRDPDWTIETRPSKDLEEQPTDPPYTIDEDINPDDAVGVPTDPDAPGESK